MDVLRGQAEGVSQQAKVIGQRQAKGLCPFPFDLSLTSAFCPLTCRSLPASVSSHRREGIDSERPPCRNQAGQAGDDEDRRQDDGVGGRVSWGEAEECAGDDAGPGE